MNIAKSSLPKVLFVDDEPELREVLLLYTSDMGFQQCEAGNGIEAMEILRKEDIALVVTDLSMPRMGGMELIQTARSEGLLTPFIIVTAYASKESAVEAMRLGAFDYVDKPLDATHLKRVISEALKLSLTRRADMAGSVGNVPVSDSVESASAKEAMQQIMQLRYSRYQLGGTGGQPDKERAHVVQMFVAEVLPQFVFCEAAINGLSVSEENRVYDLAYLARVAHSISATAEAIGEKDLHTLAHAMEELSLALRVKPTAASDANIALLREANNAMHVLVDALGGGEDPGLEPAEDLARRVLERSKAV